MIKSSYVVYNDIHSIGVGTAHLRLMRGTDASYLRLTNKQDDFNNYPPLHFLMLDELVYGAVKEVIFNTAIEIHLTGAHWGLDGGGDQSNIRLYVYRINANGNLVWGISKVNYLEDLTYGFDTIQNNIISDNMMLVNIAGASSSDLCEIVGYITADFTDASNDWIVSNIVGKNRPYPSIPSAVGKKTSGTSAFCMTDGTGTPVNCSAPTVVSGKTRITIGWTYTMNTNPGLPAGELTVIVEGMVIPRYFVGVVGSYYTEVTNNTIDLWTDLSTQSLSIQIQ